MESGLHRLEPTEQEIQDYAQELKKESSFLEIVEAITCHCSNSQASNHRLGVVREHMLRSWYQPVRGSVWSEHKVFERLRNLSLVPEQQSSVDSGVRVDQWAISNTRSQQPFNAMCKRLIYLINANHQASTILMANGDFITDHRVEIKDALPMQLKEPFSPSGRETFFIWVLKAW